MGRPSRSPMVSAATFLALALLLAVFLAWPASPALADDGEVSPGGSGNYYPLTSTDIRMESETVQAICYRSFAEYRADFLFVNAGKARTVLLGFPFATDSENPEADPVAFRAWQDGKPLAVTVGLGPGDSYQGYYLHQARFPAGKTMIRVTYLVEPSAESGIRFPELTPPEFAVAGIQGTGTGYDYWLHSGAGWAGTIGTAVICYTLADDFRGYGLDVKSDYESPDGNGGYTTWPETYVKLDDHTYQWVFKDLEPTDIDDIALAFTGLSLESDDSESVPASMGPVMSRVTTSRPASTEGDPGRLAIDGSPFSAFALRGSHPWIQVGVKGDHAVSEFRIVPGRNDAPGSFEQYGRPKTIKLTLSDGTTSTIRLADEPSVQKFPVKGTAEWARLDIVDTYPGSKSADIYISEVRFGSRPAPAFVPYAKLVTASPTVGASSTMPVTSSTLPVTSSTEPVTSETVPVTSSIPPTSSSTAPSSTSTSPSPGTSLASTGTTTGPAGTQAQDSLWTVWPIVLLALTVAAFIAAIVLAAILISRRRRRPA